MLWHPYADFSKHEGPLVMKLYSNAFFGENPQGTWYLEAYTVDGREAKIKMQSTPEDEVQNGPGDAEDEAQLEVSGLRFYYGNYDHPAGSVASTQ